MAIHDGALRILDEVGVIVDDDETRRDLLENRGCRQDEDGYVRIPPARVEAALQTVPRRVELYNREGEHGLSIRPPTAPPTVPATTVSTSWITAPASSGPAY